MGDICRLCLRRVSLENLQNIFQCKLKNSEEDEALTNLLFWTFGVEVDVSDSYAKDICQKCVDLVELILRYRKDFKFNQDLLKSGTKFEIQNSEPTLNYSPELHERGEPENEKIRISSSDLELFCARPTITVRKLEQTYEYQTFKKIGPRRFKKRKKPKLDLDESVVNDICRSLESSKFRDLSNPQTRNIGINTTDIELISDNNKCTNCGKLNESTSKPSEECILDHDSGVENDDFVQDIIQQNVNFTSKDDFQDWTQINFRKDIGVETDQISLNSVAVGTDESTMSPLKINHDDYRRFKLKMKDSYVNDHQILQSLTDDKFLWQETLNRIVGVENINSKDLFKTDINSKSFSSVGTITDLDISVKKPQTKSVGTLTKTQYLTKTHKNRIIKNYLKEHKQITVQKQITQRSIATITDPLRDKFVVDNEALELFSPIVLLTPLEYTVEKDYEQVDDVTFLPIERPDPEIVRERQKRFIDYYYGFSSFGIRELVSGSIFRENEKQNTDMAVCQVSSVSDVYICNLCSKQFSRESALKCHSAVHQENQKDTKKAEPKKFKKKKKEVKVKASKKEPHNRKSKSKGYSAIEFVNVDNTNKQKSKISSLDISTSETESAEEIEPDCQDNSSNKKMLSMKLQLSENNVDIFFSCNKCNFTCTDEQILYSHRRTTHTQDKSPSLNGMDHNNIEVVYHCDQCDFYLDNEKSLFNHQRNAHGMRHYSVLKEESSSESECDVIDIEADPRLSQSKKRKRNSQPKYIWESKELGKYCALSSTRQKQNVMNSSDDSCSSPTVTPQRKKGRATIEDDLEEVRNLQKSIKINRRRSILDDTISKLTTRLDDTF